MAKIRELSAAEVDKIAAGEVVERPASVVKELVENCLDAESRQIHVALEGGGRDLIRVSDDGVGIPPEELPLAFKSHATSKLPTFDTLFKVGTLGFRGEALASIGAVSHCRVVSRLRGGAEAWSIADDGGDLSPLAPAAGPEGTLVEARSLFFNVPARRKFLRDPGTELGHIQDVVHRYALAYPAVRFELTHDGRTLHALPPAQDPLDRIRHFEGEEVARALLKAEASDAGYAVEAWLGPPSLQRGNSALQFFFLNRRYVKDRVLYKAVGDAYRDLLEPRRFPIVFLFLTCPPDQVDVNVHPTKLEVRFQNSSRVLQLVLGCLRGKLLRHVGAFPLRPGQLSGGSQAPPWRNPAWPPGAAAPGAGAPQWPAANSPQPPSAPPHALLPTSPADRQAVLATELDAFFSAAGPAASSPTAPPAAAATPPGPGPADTSAIPAVQGPAIPVFAGAAHRFAQLHDSYIIEEADDGIVIIDQHALHERMLYFEFRERVLGGKVARQRLLLPVVLDLSPTRRAALDRTLPTLRQLGFEVEPVGRDAVAISAVPDFLARFDPGRVLAGFLDELEEDGAQRVGTELLEETLAMMACKAAVKAGDRLAETELRHLLALRGRYEHTLTCPHGRPTTLKLSLVDLEKHFHRR
ncbi:MAG: DNA mismatch repair endonuclease MutL [Planctomycetes bacterium]|nr:DNA mismatch repair endonuclease MutL [Planctomycetota bacterium]